MIHGNGGLDLRKVRRLPGVTVTVEPEGNQEISHVLLDTHRPPLDDSTARRAIAMAVDRARLNEIVNGGTSRLADQVFDTGVTGYLSHPGFPRYDPAGARTLVARYKARHGGRFALQLASTFDQTSQRLVLELARELELAGISVDLPAPVDQATIINQAIGGTVDAFLWRNYQGLGPDTLSAWFHSGSALDLNRIHDPIIDEALEKGRSEPDPDRRRRYYEAFNRRMSGQAYNLWLWYTQWFVASRDNVHGIIGPNLPDTSGAPGARKAAPVLFGYHQLLGIWKS